MDSEKEEIVLSEILYKKGSSLFELLEALSAFHPPSRAREILNKAAKNILIYHAYEDKFILEKLIKSRSGKSIFFEEVYCAEELLKNIFKFLNELVSMNFSPESTYSGCILESLEKYANGSGKKAIQYQWILKKLEEKIKLSCRDEDFLSALFNYLRYMRTTYGLISLLSFDELKVLDEELKKDPLTGALNRRVLKGIMKGILELSFISETPFTVALVDLDDFKKVNDGYGHKVGDCILKEVVKIMRENLRKGDYLFRYGGEEFLLVIPTAGQEEARKILHKLKSKIEERVFRCDGNELRVTVSIGAFSGVHDGETPYYEYIKLADEKLYEAKREGKNRVVI
ncbi:MAG: GGDEF domain-containing protein [Aquificae bacterium]|nr:GGDEF domain-containing protein [Aquificota bacterium]